MFGSLHKMVHEGARKVSLALSSTDTPEFHFLYCLNGSQVVSSLRVILEESSYPIAEYPIGSESKVDTSPEHFSSIQILVAVITKDALKDEQFVQVLREAKKHDGVKIILLHDASTCGFPSHSDIPESILSLFSEKATTYLREYAEYVADYLMEIKRKMKTVALIKQDLRNFSAIISSGIISSQDSIHTNFFLSHRRSTAQGIAGRLYESLKEEYDVFLDSETQFKIHDLEIIVQQTDIFVFILSKDYVDSEWCLKEIKTAILNKKKIVIVRDLGYPTLQDFAEKAKEFLSPVTIEDVQHVINEAPTYTWMAEYHHACVAKLKKEGEPYIKRNLHSHLKYMKTSAKQMW